jgi:hypothetical protein
VTHPRALVTTTLACVTMTLLAACEPPPARPPSAGVVPAAPAGPAAPAPPPRAGPAAGSLGVPVGADKIAPYTPEQIRDATPPGRTYRYRIERAGKSTKLDEMRFVRVDATGADVMSTSRDESGPRGEPKTRTVTWAELRAHGEFPRALVTVTEEPIDLPAGHFSCMVFTLKSPDANEVSRFFFAREIPGAPVFYTTERDGQRVLTATLLEHKR